MASTAAAANGSNLPFLVDYAKSGRSRCNTTKNAIPTGTLRLATMVKSRHFDGMQPNWNIAKEFLTAKTRRKRPQTTEEIDGYDDLRPEDQIRIETWIRNYASDGKDTDDATTRAKKQAVREQLSLVWKIRDITTGQTGKKAALPNATMKSILENNKIVVDKATADNLVKALADAIVFGVAPEGDTAKGCCATRPLTYCSYTCQYVCQAPQAWGACPYTQAVDDTKCRTITLPSKLLSSANKKSNSVAEAWLESVQDTMGSSDLAALDPRKRLYIPKTLQVTQKTPAVASSKKTKAPTKPPPKKGTPKPTMSRACVDPESGVASSHHVLDEGFNNGATPDFAEAFPVDLYDTALCQTDLSSGTNSQYKLQILTRDDNVKSSTTNNTVYLWRVWGRVGGQGGGGTKLEKFDTADLAKAEFCKLFRKYTGNNWEDRNIFVKHPGKFFQLDVSYNDNEDASNPISSSGSSSSSSKAKVVAGDSKSKLDLRVQEVVAAMFDKGIALNQLKSLKVDLNKMPLGKITEAQLKDAYAVLTDIEKIIQPSSQQQGSQRTDAMKKGRLQQLSNQFYSKCPSTNPILIDNMKLLKNQVEMVDELINLMASNKVMNDDGAGNAALAPVDAAYQRLKTGLTPLDPAGEHFAMLKQYVANTRNATLPGVGGFGSNDWERRGLRLLDAFEVEREGEATRFAPSKSLGNRRLLWHGSRISNYSGILGQGLRIAPPEAPVSGYRFGKGVYFADMLGKSANYCRTDGSSEMFIMACDVSLGKTFETPRDMYMEKPQHGTNSTHALSDIIPNPAMSMQMSDSHDKVTQGGATGRASTDKVLVPLGTPVRNSNLLQSPSCDVSEFIVYDQAQVQIRYLLRLTTNPSTKAADGTVGTANKANSARTRIRVPLNNSMHNSVAATQAWASSVAARQVGGTSDDDSDDSDSDDSAGPPMKKQKRPVASFIRLEKEDRSKPSLSGLKLLNSRTFVEGLRLTVVRGDITESATSAIVLPTDGQLSMGGMVGTKVQQKAGSAFVAEVNTLLFSQSAPTNQPSSTTATSQLPSNIKRLDTTTAGKTIRELATAANLPYLTPFYKVVKKEDVSATKDLICLEASGAFHRGRTARTFLGIALDKKVSISPAQIPPGAEVFVQSSSHNRKIPNQSAVLLETSATPAAVAPPPAAIPQQKKTLQTGEACVVGGHDLLAAHVVMVVSPIFSLQPSPMVAEQALKLAVKNVLQECSCLQLDTVTLPSIGSGRAGYDKGAAAAWIIGAIADYLEEVGSGKKQSIKEVCFCLFDDESLEAYRQGILSHDKKKPN